MGTHYYYRRSLDFGLEKVSIEKNTGESALIQLSQEKVDTIAPNLEEAIKSLLRTPECRGIHAADEGHSFNKGSAEPTLLGEKPLDAPRFSAGRLYG